MAEPACNGFARHQRVPDAGARLARLCVALAAGRAGGTAGDLVAVAGDPAGAAAHRLPGDPAAARADAARGDAGAHAVVADPAAHLLAALVILALAHPLLNPQARLAGSGPLALVIDDGWTAARDWSRRQAAAIDLLAEAEREDRQVVLVTTAPLASDEPPPALAPIRAADARAAVEALRPKPWPGDRAAALPAPRGDAACRRAAPRSGSATASTTAPPQRWRPISPNAAACAISRRRRTMRRACSRPTRLPASWRPRTSRSSLRSLPAPVPRPIAVRASGEDGALAGARDRDDRARRQQRRGPAAYAGRIAQPGRPGSRSRARNRPAACCWSTSAGGAARSASPRRANAAGQPLLSENYYLERALGPFTEVRRGRAADLLKREHRGADLFRCRPGFAGRGGKHRQMGRGRRRCCCASPARASPSRATRCCRCGCAAAAARIGGALSWEQPARLAPFAADSPFAGLAIPADVTVCAPGPGRAGSRPRRQDLGTAGRRHAAGHGRKARRRVGLCWCIRRPMPTGPTSRFPGCSSRCCGGSWR